MRCRPVLDRHTWWPKTGNHHRIINESYLILLKPANDITVFLLTYDVEQVL